MSRQLIRPLLMLSIGLFGMAALGPVYNTYVPLLLHDLGLNATLVGFVMTWDNWLNAFIPPWVGLQSDRRWTRFGRRKPWIFLGASLAVGYMLIPAVSNLALLLGVILITNLGLAIARSPGLALLGDLFPPRARSTASGVINVFGGLGAVTALVASRFLSPAGAVLPFLFTGLLFIVGVAVLLLAIEERSREHQAVLPVDSVWSSLRRLVGGEDRRSALLLLGIFFGFCGFSVAETWLTSYARYQLHVSETRLPLLMAVFAGALLLSAIPSGIMASRWNRKGVVLGGMSALALILASAWWVRSESALFVILALAGMAWAPTLINTLPLLYDVAGDVEFGALTGFYYLFISLAGVLGPQAVGIALDLSEGNYQLVWVVAALFVTLGALLVQRVQTSPAK